MIETGSHRISRSRKKNSIPLSNLRTSEVVRVVVNHPGRLNELIGLLEERNLSVKGRAAATIGQLSDTHARRLVRNLDRILESLSDDSAYVRWSLVYALGRIAAAHPACMTEIIRNLLAATEDTNRLVRVMACRAIVGVYSSRPQQVRNSLESLQKPMPDAVARSIKTMKKSISRCSSEIHRPE
jgi:HEAT repeat protein